MRRAGKRVRATLAISVAAMAGFAASALAEPKVVVTMKPIHSLVAAVMEGVGSPDLLIKGAASPHTYALKPSDARALNQADIFFRMSDTVEPFSGKVIKSLPKSVQSVTLQDAPGLKLLGLRRGATFEQHSHGKSKHGHGHHGHSHSHPKAGDAIDGHAWLDPGNAKAMADRIAQVLSAKYPEQAAKFAANATALKARIDALAAELERDLAPVADKPYIVFHDAYQYLERRYGLSVAGSISVSPDVPPSAKRLTELRRKIMSLGAVCVFAEPQFEPKVVASLIEGTPARTGTLDPEGGRLEPAPDLYFTLMRNLARDLKACLAPSA
jgi:zinc transport system substrate-binding protein